MEDMFKMCLWKNFAAAIDMLKDVITTCPDALWLEEKKFFFMAYHTTIFLDYYLSHPVKAFVPGLPYTILPDSELPPDAIDDVIPDRHFTRQEMVSYLNEIRRKCKILVLESSSQEMNTIWIDKSEINLHGLCPSIVEQYTVLDILFYNFRHVQHHVAQLNFILRNKAGVAVDWISHAH